MYRVCLYIELYLAPIESNRRVFNGIVVAIFGIA